jgi:polysaccharide export outer membrane protein
MISDSIRAAFCAVGCLVFLLGTTVASGQSTDTALDAYLVQPGDTLEVSVWKEPDLQREVLIRPDGAFSFPLTGDIQAYGRSIEEIRNEVTQKLSRLIPDLVVTVTVRKLDGNKIYVIGQVRNAGAFVVNPRVDVMQALSIAGGATPFAALDDIKIIRRVGGSQQTIDFNYGEVAKGRRLEQNILLRSGDIVVVP